MTVGRKKKVDKPVEWKVNVPSTTAAQVELRLLDPVTHKTRYGARGQLITRLLNEWLERQKQGEDNER